MESFPLRLILSFDQNLKIPVQGEHPHVSGAGIQKSVHHEYRHLPMSCIWVFAGQLYTSIHSTHCYLAVYVNKFMAMALLLIYHPVVLVVTAGTRALTGNGSAQCVAMDSGK